MCYRTARPHFLTVTWPDGRLESLDFTPNGLNTFYSVAAIPSYTGGPRTTSRLEAAPGDSDAGWRGDGNLYDGGFAEGDVEDPQRFVLVDQDGSRYLLDRTDGLVEANTLTVDAEGIRSSNGETITFDRGDDGRISSLEGPGGGQVSYRRDETGDGLFRRFTYDGDGRLRTVTDATGATSSLDLDVAGRSEVITNPTGTLTTRSVFDDHGNLSTLDRMHDGSNRSMSFGYDGNDQLISRTDSAGNQWSLSYDDDQNMTYCNAILIDVAPHLRRRRSGS